MAMKLDDNLFPAESSQNILVTGCLGIILLFPWVFVFALPPLQMGIWFNTEGVAWGIASLGAFASLILLCVCIDDIKKSHTGYLYVHLSRTNPLLLGTVGLAATSVIMLPFSFDKHLSWFGHPEQMTGGWLWLSISAIMLCYLWLRQSPHYPKYKQAIRISVEFACYAQIALVLFAHPQFTNASGNWVLYHFTSHLGWIGACLLILSIGNFGKLSFVTRFFAIVAILLSQNKIALGALIGGPILYMITSKYRPPEKRGITLLIVLLGAPLSLIIAEYMAFSWVILPTLSSRFISLKVLWADYIHAPLLNLFTGMGWGQMSDSILRQLPSLKSSSLQEATWEGIGRFDASSLNQTADALAAVGIIGAVGSFLISLSLFLLSRKYFNQQENCFKQKVDKSFLFTACLITMLLHHGWFMMLSILPIFISTVITSDIPDIIKLKKDVQRNGIKNKDVQATKFLRCIAAGLSGVVLLWTSHSIYSTAVFYSGDLKSLPVRLAWKFKADYLLNCENLVANRGPGSIPLAFWLRSYQSSTNPFKQDQTISQEIKCALKTIRQCSSHPPLTLLSLVQD